MILLEPEDYYTQRNNRLHPTAACMNTSRVMFYKAANIAYVHESGTPDDDYFYSLLDSDRAKAFRDSKYPNLSDYHPTEIHGMYGSFLDPLVTGKRISDFHTDLTWDDFINQIALCKPVMTSGKFPGLLGHAFVFIGYDDKTDELIAADPWGDPHTGYKSVHGYGIRYNREYFNEHVKPGANKWGHLIMEDI